MRDDNLTTDIVTDFSSLPDAIVCYLSHTNADLIGIGTKSSTRLRRFLMRKVADSVVRLAHSPVLAGLVVR